MSRTRLFAVALALVAPLAAGAQCVKLDTGPTLDGLEPATRSAMRPARVSAAAQACMRRLPGRSPGDMALCTEQQARCRTRRGEQLPDGVEAAVRAGDATVARTEAAAELPFTPPNGLALTQATWEDRRATRRAAGAASD